ncbi:MAG: hypothetical protein HOP33_09605 [Verrucomicrobia bacterium]|nr:hypothetical protein [Verrucomicrobiota bacterium]
MKTETKSQQSEASGQRPAARSVLECGGKRSATPLSHAGWFSNRRQPASARKLRRRCASLATPALTLTLSPGEREQRADASSFTNAHPADSDSRSAERRRMILPLLGERAGVRASVGLISLLLFSAALVHAQSYSVDWFTIAGGGGTSTNGQYSVSGTIGQPDAGGPMTNSQYSVTGGFWALPTAVQVTGAPTLTIVPATPGNATLSWSPSTPGFVLQQTWSLSPANWTNSPSGATNPITVPAKFYRLFKP